MAEEIGLLDKVMTEGWKSLTSKETGRIGGLVTRKKKQRSGGQNISLQKIDKFDRIIHPRETTGDVYERKNKCFVVRKWTA